MNQLIIGIDGGDERILRHFEMPFVHSLFERSASHELREDVWSRGWAEMYTGRHARETKAFYEMPALDGTRRFHRKFSWKDSAQNPEVKFLWDLVDESGIKSLFMNIPTTFPTPTLKHGVFVAGAGGGLNDVSKIPDGLCSSDEARRILEDSGYVVDLRYKPSGITELEVLFAELDKMMERRAEGFVKLARHFGSEFGFIAFRATTIVQYVAMSEIEMLIGGLEMPELFSGPDSAERPIHRLIKQHYRALDRVIEHLFTELDPKHFILTADHGHAPFLKIANLNPMLVKLGYQKRSAAGRNLKRKIGSLLPKKLSMKLVKAAPVAVKEMSRGYDVRVSRAFSQPNIHGIYINDEKRFGGPVAEGPELDKLVEDICLAFNKDPEVKENGMSAAPYRRHHPDAAFADFLPDIWVERPEEIFFDGLGEKFVEPNPQFAPIFDLKDVPTDVNSGQKGRRPLFYCDQDTSSLVEQAGCNDLTVVYKACREQIHLDQQNQEDGNV